MIDILLAVYNGQAYLSEQLNSIFRQTNQEFHIWVGDDGSNDQTLNIVQKYQEQYPDKITCCNSKINGGSPQKNFFRLMEHSTAPYVMTCDHDDVWLDDKVEKTLRCMRHIEKQFPQKPVLVHTDLAVVNHKLEVIAPSMFRSQKLNYNARSLRELIVQNNVTGCTMMVNKTLLSYVKETPEQALMHDWWLALIAAAFGVIGFVNEPTILYRQHEKNQVGAKSASDIGFLASRMIHKKQVKQSIAATYAQARAFLQEYNSRLSEQDKQMLKQYCSIPAKNKFGRWNTLVSGRFYKYGFARKAGQFLYI